MDLRKSIRKSTGHCTHINLTRLYVGDDGQECMLCYRRPELGFLYRCTQDTNGALPETNLVDEDLTQHLTDFNLDHRSSELLPDPENTSSRASTPDVSSTKATAQDKIINDSDSATDELLARAYDGKRKFEEAFPPKRKVTPASPCNFQVCHACRPTYKERAWQSLDHIVNNPPFLPSRLELNNRRISKATTILDMKPSQSVPSYRGNWYESNSCTNIPNEQAEPHVHEYEPNEERAQTGCQKEPDGQDDGVDADDEKGFAKDDTDDSSSSSESSSSSDHDNAHRPRAGHRLRYISQYIDTRRRRPKSRPAMTKTTAITPPGDVGINEAEPIRHTTDETKHTLWDDDGPTNVLRARSSNG